MTAPRSAIGLTRFEMERGQKFERHVHEKHQLAWASSGVLTVEIENDYWVLPTTLALWIPAGAWHASLAIRESVMQGIYLDPEASPVAWNQPTVLAVTPLARNLIEYLVGERTESARLHAESVLFDVLQPVQKATIEVPLPDDDRARGVARILLEHPADQRNLDELGRQVGASPRTLLRLFLTETGMTFSQWRTHARLQASMPSLADGQPIFRVADQVGYSTPSAFVAAFRRVTGHTPAAYFADDETATDNPPTAGS